MLIRAQHIKASRRSLLCAFAHVDIKFSRFSARGFVSTLDGDNHH
jgi:hypothetical protein